MIRDRVIAQAVKLHYKGSVTTANIFMDGVSKATITNLPAHAVGGTDRHKTRRITLPAGVTGFSPQFTTDSISKVDHAFELIQASTFSRQSIWHYFEMTYTGTINVTAYVDEVSLFSAAKVFELPTGVQQHTAKVYLPPLSFGYIPHLLNETNDAGDIISAKPVVLPVRHYKGIRSVSECQITYKGNLQVQFYMDGRELGNPYQFDKVQDNDDTPSRYVTKKFYFPAGSIGHIFQWEQVSGLLETDASFASGPEEPQTVEHG